MVGRRSRLQVMLRFDAGLARVLRAAIEAFGERMHVEVGEPVAEQLRGYRPPELETIEQELRLVGQQLTSGEQAFHVHEIHGRLLKAVVIHRRRELANSIDEPRRRTGHRAAIRFLEKELRLLEKVMHEPWFSRVEVARVPRLTDYVSVRFAEQALGDRSKLEPRVYDEKFHILEAPGLFTSDLSCLRRRCALRQRPLAVAFLDIDDFKAFNTKYGETRVDRDVLPPFMECVEASVFGHGHAYRFGGDEYVVLLPNVTSEQAVAFVVALQGSALALDLVGIDERPTLSCGVCAVDGHTFLTDSEVLERANAAKNFAKEHGKDRVAWFEGGLYRDDDLRCSGPATGEPSLARPRAT